MSNYKWLNCVIQVNKICTEKTFHCRFSTMDRIDMLEAILKIVLVKFQKVKVHKTHQIIMDTEFI